MVFIQYACQAGIATVLITANLGEIDPVDRRHREVRHVLSDDQYSTLRFCYRDFFKVCALFFLSREGAGPLGHFFRAGEDGLEKVE
jgi:hypothetical protein